MKKKVLMLCALLYGLAVLLTACVDNEVAPPDTQGKADHSADCHDHQPLTATEVPIDGEAISFDADEPFSVPEIGLENVFVKAESSLTKLDEQTEAIVYLLADDRYGGGGMPIDSYVVVVSEGRILAEDCSLWGIPACHRASMELVDTDGDGDCEIVLQFGVVSTGAGRWFSYVLDYKDDAFVKRFSSENDGELIDTGFSITLLRDRRYMIRNLLSGYEEEFVREGEGDDYFKFWYDEQGEPLSRDIAVDSFFSFEPTDVNGDDVFEIVGKQYVSLVDHSDHIGNAVTVWGYRVDSAAFEMIDAHFERCD